MDELEIFEKYLKDEVLTPEAREEIATLFQAKVNEKVAIEAEALKKEMDEVLLQKEEELDELKKQAEDLINGEANKIHDEQETFKKELEDEYLKEAEKQYEDLVVKTSNYIDESAKELVKQNKVKIYNAVMVEKCKSLISGIKKVFEENDIELPEPEADTVQDLYEKIDELEDKIDSLIQDKTELQQENEELEKALVFIKNTDDLSEMDKQKCLNMMDGIQTESIQDFKSKLNLIKKNLITEKRSYFRKEEVDDVEDKVEDDKSEKENDEDKISQSDIETIMQGLKLLCNK
jgi:hypothetical protein